MRITAGRVQRGDLQVTITDPNAPRTIEIHSTVERLFGSTIANTCKHVLDELHIENGHFFIEDQQAFDFVIRARIRCALARMEEHQ